VDATQRCTAERLGELRASRATASGERSIAATVARATDRTRSIAIGSRAVITISIGRTIRVGERARARRRVQRSRRMAVASASI
jgi:hypothetical protein